MNTDIAPRKPCAHLSDDERDRAMLVLALNGSHAGKAHTQLKGEGLQISERQLKNYRHWPRYQEIRDTQAKLIEENLLTHYKDAARLSVELQIAATIDTLTNLEAGELKPADTAKVAQQAAVASGIALDKAMLVEGRPTSIQGQVDIDTDIQTMARLMGFSVDSTATEIPPEPEHSTTPLIPESASANAQP